MKLHWHSMPVADIHMSANFIYSAGSEGVLVRWDLESEERQFLPRLGMPIKQLAVAHNEKYVVCAHTDNSGCHLELIIGLFEKSRLERVNTLSAGFGLKFWL